MASVSITYQCCKATYSGEIRLFPSPAAIVPVLDELHAADHPECPPLHAPLPEAS